MSVAYAVDFAALVLLGPHQAMVVALGGVLMQCGLRPEHRTPVLRAIFNAASLVIAIQAAGLAVSLAGGAAPAMQDMLAGQIDLFCPEAGQTLSHYRGGSIKAYAVLTQKRWFAAPDVPMIDEAGVPGLHFPFWHALWAPKGTPKDVIATLNGAVVDALADPAVRQRLTELGHEIAPREQQSPAALAAYHKAEIEKWWPIIKAANIKGE